MTSNNFMLAALIVLLATLALSIIRLYFSLLSKMNKQKSFEVRNKLIDYEHIDIKAFIKDIRQKKLSQKKALLEYKSLASRIAERNNIELEPAHLFPSLSKEEYYLSLIRVYGPNGIMEKKYTQLRQRN